MRWGGGGLWVGWGKWVVEWRIILVWDEHGRDLDCGVGGGDGACEGSSSGGLWGMR